MNPASIVALLAAVAPLLQGAITLIPQLGQVVTGLIPQPTTTTTTTTPASNPTVVLLQEGLNLLAQQGVITLAAPLATDGVFGGSTFAAIKLLQAKFGFSVQEPLASLEEQLLATILAKL